MSFKSGVKGRKVTDAPAAYRVFSRPTFSFTIQ